jgi:outer membrane protein OmpA-like peptidoglycan-associated protein
MGGGIMGKKLTISVLVVLCMVSLSFGHFMYQSDCEWLTTPSTYGPNAVFYNPALLSYHKNPSFALEFLRLGIDVTNNTFSVSNWNDFVDHDTLQDDYKNTILGLVPSDGFDAAIGANAGMFGVKFGSFAFCPRVVVGSSMEFPKDAIDLSLFGNSLGRTYDLTGTRIEAMAYQEYGIGYSKPFQIGEDRKLYTGISITYVRGIAYAAIDRINGSFTSDSLYLAADMDTAQYKLSYSGWGSNQGVSSNIGFAMDVNDKVLIDLSFRNLLSYVGWVHELETGFAAGHLDPINAFRFVSRYAHHDWQDSVTYDTKWEEVFDEYFYDLDTARTTEQDAQFSTSLPILMNFGLSYENSETWKLFGQYEQGFTTGAMTTTMPRVTLSGEYNPWMVLPLRAGFSFGGNETFAMMVGFGLSYEQFYMDFGYGAHKGVLMGAKGQSLAFDIGIRSSLKAKVHGTIRDSVTLKPLVAEVHYQIGDQKGKLTSKEDGTYSISVAAGKLGMIARADGYYDKKVMVTVEPGQSTRQDILMSPKFGYVAVTVMDSVTSEPLAAKIVITGAEQSEEMNADEKGEASIKLLAGDYKFDVSYPEYAPAVRKVTVPRGQEVKKVFRLMKAGGMIKGLVYDALTKEPVPSAISVVDAATNAEVTLIQTDEKGAYRVGLKKGTYMLKVTPGPKDYIYQEATIPLASGETVNRDFALLKKKMKFVFHNILFDFDKATLRPESYPVLDSIGKIMIENPTIITELSGHTDSRGSRSYNAQLSQRRADSARNYIVQQWRIEPMRIIAKGYGEDVPIIPNATTEDQHQQNRRVEFTVIREK